MQRGGLLWLVALLVAVGLVGLGLSALAAPTGENVDGNSPNEQIEDLQTFALAPDRAGEIEVRHEFDIPDRVTHFQVRVPARATDIEASGFIQEDDRVYVWDGNDAEPTISYHANVDRTVERDGPIAGPGDFLFVDAGEWALFQRPTPAYSWDWSGEPRVGIDRSAATDGPGEVGDVLAFLGPHERHTHEEHGQEFVLIEPDRANLAEEPAEIFASVAHASDRLRVGDRDDRVLMIAAPTGEVEWGVRGLQTGPADMWVRDVEALDTADNVWVHEYVHARQDYSTTDDARWFTEATATYYAALLTLQEERISFEEFQAHLQRGTHERFDGVRLIDRATWRNNPDYLLGSLVTAELDRQIRLATGGSASFADVFRKVNEHDGSLDHAAVREMLASVGGDDVANSGDRYLSTTDRPISWDRSGHDAAFATEPPRYATETTQLRASGAYRDRALSIDDPEVVVTGEDVTISVAVTNLGDVAGEYDFPVRVHGVPVDRVTGELGPGESETVEVTHRFEDTGTHRVVVGEARQDVEVRRPAVAHVRSFSVEPTRVDPGDEVTVTVTVENDATYPGEATLAITRDGETVREPTVRLDRESSETLTEMVRLPRAGAVRIGIRDSGLAAETVTVGTVDDPTARALNAGIVVAIVGILGALVLLAYRYRDR